MSEITNKLPACFKTYSYDKLSECRECKYMEPCSAHAYEDAVLEEDKVRTLLIAGSRNLTEADAVFASTVCGLILNKADTLLNGGATGVDTLAHDAAKHVGATAIRCLPDWKTHGKSAGPIRNKQMVDMADEIIVLWDGKSRGTKNVINLAKRARKPLDVYLLPSAR